MLPRTSVRQDGWLAIVLEGLRHVGCAVVEGVLDDLFVQSTREAIYRALEAVHGELGGERLRRAGERGVLRIPMRFEPHFYRFLAIPAVLEVVNATISKTAILHVQNAFALPDMTTEQDHSVFQTRFHMDFPRILNRYLCSVNVFFAIDGFTQDNGATLVVPGTHQKSERPDPRYLREAAVAVECVSGSMLVFDSTLWHAAGQNRSGVDRLAVNHQFTRSYFKQQIDYVRALGDEAINGLAPRTQQLLGWHTRVVTSLAEYYLPAEERLYRAGQG